MLSVVIPAFNEQEMVPAAAGQIDGILSRAGIPHELIFIDDGSRDATWAEIRAESEHRDTVRGVHFSRNFRKEAAIFAGLQAADGDCVAVIDCDLQHPPEKLVEMYRLWEQGVEVVEGVKTDRGEESLAHRVAAKTFYRLISEATHIDMTRASDFKLLVTQFVAFPCSIIYGKLAGRFGSKTMITAAVVAYMCIVFFAAFFLRAALEFWILAILVGMFQGGIQALSRSYYGKIIPKDHANEYYGFYDIFGKTASIIGTFLVATTTSLTGNASIGVLSIAILLAVALVFLLLQKDPTKGSTAAATVD